MGAVPMIGPGGAVNRRDGSRLPAALDVRRVLVDGVWHERLSDRAAIRAVAGGRRSRFGAVATPRPLVIEPDRYHLYVSYACPFAHRAILGRALLGLEGVIAMSILHPHIAGPNGWSFAAGAPDGDFTDVTDDLANGHRYLYEVYRHGDARYSGRVSVPVLWDQRLETMVSNESSEVLRIFSTDFRPAGEGHDLYPKELAPEIDAMNEWLGRRVNSAVYRVGLAPGAAAHERERQRLFDAFDDLERHLESRRFLVGDSPTESDIRLYVTWIRFDLAYREALGCDLRVASEYPRLSRHAKRLERIPGVRETVKPDHIRRHYFADDSFVGVQRRRKGACRAASYSGGSASASSELG